MAVMSQFSNTALLLNFFDVVLYLLWSLVSGPSFISISWLILELWQSLFIRDLIRNSEIENTPVWGFFNIWRLERVKDANLAWMSLMEHYLMLQNARFTVFTTAELLRENQHGVKISPSRFGLIVQPIFQKKYQEKF